MAKEVFVNTAKTVVDFYATVHITDKKRFFEMVEVEGEEHLKTAYEQKKGVICLVPHLSSWELSAVTPPMLGYHFGSQQSHKRLSHSANDGAFSQSARYEKYFA